MRKIFLVFVMVMLAFSVIAAPQVLTVLCVNDTPLKNGSTQFTMAVDMLHKDFPDVKVEFLKIDTSDGSALTMDAMLAAGNAPNVYTDTMVRASKYMVPEFALPLQNFIRDLNKYNPGILDQYKRSGNLLAMPGHGSAQGMCINLDIMKEIGYVVPANWTIDDFLKMAQLVKDKYKGKKFATGMFAQNQSGDYLLHNWFPAFGAQYYVNGDYNKSVIADTGGAKVYAFYQALVKNGFVPPNSESLNDDDYALSWSLGQFAATAFFPAWCEGYFKTAIDQKLIEKPFNYTFVPFPRAPGVKNVPTYSSVGAYIVHKTGTDIDKVAARFVEYAMSAPIQTELGKLGYPPSRVDSIGSDDPMVKAVGKIVAAGGIYDAGLTDPRFTERRALQFPILQKVLTFKLTPERAIKQYQDALSAVK